MILCCGEALIDMVPDISASGKDVLRPLAGGSVFNTAIALSRLNQKVGFLSGISTDGFGRQLIAQLDNAGVDHSMSIRSERPTTLAIVELVDGEAHYQFYDEGSACRMITIDDLPKIPANTSLLLFGGISLISQPCANTLEHFHQTASQKHFTFLDPNIRPGFINDPEAHQQRIIRMVKNSDIVKVSVADLNWIAPDCDHETTIMKWLGGRTKIVLLSKGSQGAHAYTLNHKIYVPPQEVEVVDTIGAGDTFNAGFLASISAQSEDGELNFSQFDKPILTRALQFANHVAAISTCKTGATPPSLDELTIPLRAQ